MLRLGVLGGCSFSSDLSFSGVGNTNFFGDRARLTRRAVFVAVSTKITVVAGMLGHKFPMTSFNRWGSDFRDFEVLMLLRDRFPRDLAEVIYAYSRPIPVPYDPWASLHALPEYNSRGEYGFFPEVSSDLPLFSP